MISVIFVLITKTRVPVFLMHVVCVEYSKNTRFYTFISEVLHSAAFDSLADLDYLLIIGI